MGLFWMTAPIAWLYAIPVERFFGSYSAAVANITLLGVVSLWRVLLMSRVIQVVTGRSYFRATLRVVMAASFEVLAVFFLGPISFSSRILAGMGGL